MIDVPRFEFLMAVNMQIVFWEVKPRIWVEIYSVLDESASSFFRLTSKKTVSFFFFSELIGITCFLFINKWKKKLLTKEFIT